MAKLNKAVRETGLDRSDGACSHECQGVPKEASMYGAVGWHQAQLGRSEEFACIQPRHPALIGCISLEALKLALSNKTALEFWAVGAHFRRRHWPWVLWRSPMMLKRGDTIFQHETHSGNFWLPCCSQRGSRAIVTSPAVPAMATMMITVHSAHSWPRFMSG